MSDQSTKIQLKFEGTNLGEGVIDMYDLANTILAFGQVMEGIAKSEKIDKGGKININVNALSPGSFDVSMIITVDQIQDLIIGAFPLLGVLSSKNLADYLIKIFKSVIQVKKFLKGKKSKSITINQTGENPVAVIVNVEGDSMNITMPIYNALQDKRINSGVKKMFEPLVKEGGTVEKIQFSEITSGTELLEAVTQAEVPYFESEEELQSVSKYKVKGIVTAFDRKTGNGRLSLSESKRVLFEMAYNVDLKTVEKNEVLLIESMKLKVPIIITGEATLDFESNLRKIKAEIIHPEAKLF
jgi:hypothetical protein